MRSTSSLVSILSAIWSRWSVFLEKATETRVRARLSSLDRSQCLETRLDTLSPNVPRNSTLKVREGEVVPGALELSERVLESLLRLPLSFESD